MPVPCWNTSPASNWPRATLDREARRQGERAQKLRPELDQQAALEKKQLELTLEPCQMIIQLDAGNIRERDQWGQSGAPRRAGKEPERWPWVCTGTCFRPDHRGQTAGGRPVITARGFVAARAGLAAVREQMQVEALRRGLGQAASAPVMGDGAVWIWRLADDRSGRKPVSGWTATTSCNTWLRWAGRFLEKTKPSSSAGSNPWRANSRTRVRSQ